MKLYKNFFISICMLFVTTLLIQDAQAMNPMTMDFMEILETSDAKMAKIFDDIKAHCDELRSRNTKSVAQVVVPKSFAKSSHEPDSKVTRCIELLDEAIFDEDAQWSKETRRNLIWAILWLAKKRGVLEEVYEGVCENEWKTESQRGRSHGHTNHEHDGFDYIKELCLKSLGVKKVEEIRERKHPCCVQ